MSIFVSALTSQSERRATNCTPMFRTLNDLLILYSNQYQTSTSITVETSATVSDSVVDDVAALLAFVFVAVFMVVSAAGVLLVVVFFFFLLFFVDLFALVVDVVVAIALL
jgi:hypothetical protein